MLFTTLLRVLLKLKSGIWIFAKISSFIGGIGLPPMNLIPLPLHMICMIHLGFLPSDQALPEFNIGVCETSSVTNRSFSFSSPFRTDLPEDRSTSLIFFIVLHHSAMFHSKSNREICETSR